MKKKIFGTMMAVVLATLSLAGCGDKTTPASASTEVAVSVSESEASEETTASVSEVSVTEPTAEPEITTVYRIKTKKHFDEETSNVYQIDELIYDENGVLTREGNIVYDYDANGNLIKKTAYMDNELTMLSYYVEYTYDEKGNMLSEIPYNVSYFDGTTIKSEYDVYSYDEKNRLDIDYYYWGSVSTAVDTIITARKHVYNDNGLLARIDYCSAEDLSSSTSYDVYNYDSEGKLTSIQRYGYEDEMYAEEFYEYDTRGNLIKKYSVSYEEYDPGEYERYEYEYDENNNLITESYSEIYTDTIYTYGTVYEWEVVE